jgi:hypothetical protein
MPRKIRVLIECPNVFLCVLCDLSGKSIPGTFNLSAVSVMLET